MEDPQRQNPAERDAPTKEAEGAEYAVREAMLELELHEADAGPQDPGAVTKLTVELVCIANSQFCCHACCARVVSEGSAASPVHTDTAILPGSEFSVVLLRIGDVGRHERGPPCVAGSQNQSQCG